MARAPTTDDEVERYIRAAAQHGRDSEPDHEVGDLQQLLRIAFGMMTDCQRAAFAADRQTVEILAVAEG